MDYIKAIKNYILFLKVNHNLAITLHPIKPETLIINSELINFNIHDNSYCVLVKTCNKAQNHCINRQRGILEKLNAPYIGTCFAGVKEFVYPIFNGKENVGFISVSGYKTDNPTGYIKKIAKEYVLNYSTLKEAYFYLKEEMPPKDYVDALIYPLCQMLELAYIKSENEIAEKETLPQKVMRYLKQHKNEQISSENICNKFSCSRSYMSTQFNRFAGMSIREYINTLRIEDAKLLLKNSTLNITEIALSVGFNDSNYFSCVFKNIVGVSPLKYRREG